MSPNVKMGLPQGLECARLGLWEYAHLPATVLHMFCSTIKQAARLLLLLGCTCSLSSCGAIGSILSYLVSLPANLFNAICP